MYSKITTTTAEFPLGRPPSKHLFCVESGQYRNRKVVLIQTAAGTIQLAWADPPYGSWSALTTIADDGADESFDAAMDDAGHIHVVYIEASTLNLATRKLTFGGGGWSVGSKVTIYGAWDSFHPSVAIEPEGTIWVSWSRLVSSQYQVRAKASEDDGASWGTGESDAGDALAVDKSAAFSRLVRGVSTIYAVYSYDDDTLAMRARDFGGSEWTAESQIANAASGLDHHFDAAVSDGGLLGVIYDDGSLRYRQYDGFSWSTPTELDSDEAQSPQLHFSDNVPIATYLCATGSDQKVLRQSNRRSGSFSPPVELDPAAKTFDAVKLYHHSSFSYADLTAAAAGATAADVFHPESGYLVSGAADCVCLGMDKPFRYVKFLLSTAGAGGTVAYSYWNGSAWIGFSPAGGSFNLDAADHDLLLWGDYQSIPGDWQKEAVAGDDARFWIKLQVVSSYTTAPIGSQLTAISDLTRLAVRR